MRARTLFVISGECLLAMAKNVICLLSISATSHLDWKMHKRYRKLGIKCHVEWHLVDEVGVIPVGSERICCSPQTLAVLKRTLLSPSSSLPLFLLASPFHEQDTAQGLEGGVWISNHGLNFRTFTNHVSFWSRFTNHGIRWRTDQVYQWLLVVAELL